MCLKNCKNSYKNPRDANHLRSITFENARGVPYRLRLFCTSFAEVLSSSTSVILLGICASRYLSGSIKNFLGSKYCKSVEIAPNVVAITETGQEILLKERGIDCVVLRKQGLNVKSIAPPCLQKK